MERRRKSEENDLDPLVWTNERVAKWCRSVDLGVGKLGQEYALSYELNQLFGSWGFNGRKMRLCPVKKI